MFSIASVPFLKIREVELGFEKEEELSFKNLTLMNGRSRRIGSTVIYTDEYEKFDSDKEFKVTEISTFCGHYGMMNGPADSYQIRFRDPVEIGKKIINRVFARNADIRKMWSFISCCENFKAIESISTGEKAEFYHNQAEAFQKTADEIMNSLKSEGIANDEVIYTPQYMYIFPVVRMKEEYYKIAREFQVNWVTPNVCVVEDESLFKAYFRTCREAS